MKRLDIGILAHADAGKTTLSESMLYLSGSIRKLGRVDNRDAFLDTHELERKRGITIFSKQAVLSFCDTELVLLDTPGHVDFSAEMERTLQVLDYAILVISGADGVQVHTKTLWRLLEKYKIPVFLFINKMDQNGTDRDKLMLELKATLSDACVDFTDTTKESFFEEAAVCDEKVLEEFLEHGLLTTKQLQAMIATRKVFPCFFGSALKLSGVEEFMRGIVAYTIPPVYPSEFGARVFKIMRDEQGNRLTFLKITGGSLKVKTPLTSLLEKVNQIRVYSGTKYDTVSEAEAGMICAVTGLTQTRPGEGLGMEAATIIPILEPVLNYHLLLPDGCQPAVILPKLMQLEEEIPELHIVWDEVLKEIHIQIMGEVQTEIIHSLVLERFGVSVGFGSGSIVYKETIKDIVEGVGHFEPLRHYAEVHLLLEPLEPGSGLQFETDCSEDVLSRNWQRLVLTHLYEKEHKGVLTGSAITDMKITLKAGRAHQKHTEGGDFRQATYRAVRQGLKSAVSVLLEPYYEFRLEIPDNLIGRAMTDIEKMYGSVQPPLLENGTAILIGKAPVVTMRDYQMEVTAYTKGRGKLLCSLKDYEPCHNAEEVIADIGYDSEHDLINPTGSVFCAHGAGFLVNWDEVPKYMHLESILGEQRAGKATGVVENKEETELDDFIGVDEIDAILERTFYANKKTEFVPHKGINRKYTRKKEPENHGPVVRTYEKPQSKEEYLLVDGYNVIFACEDLKELADDNLDGARGKLMDLLCNYQGVRGCQVILVFDAYRLEGHPTEIVDYHNIHVVYTKEAETADQYIEKFAHENAQRFKVTVATSDGLEQIIIRSKGCHLLSARDLWEEMKFTQKQMKETYIDSQIVKKHYLFDALSEKAAKEINDIINEANEIE